MYTSTCNRELICANNSQQIVLAAARGVEGPEPAREIGSSAGSDRIRFVHLASGQIWIHRSLSFPQTTHTPSAQ